MKSVSTGCYFKNPTTLDENNSKKKGKAFDKRVYDATVGTEHENVDKI